MGILTRATFGIEGFSELDEAAREALAEALCASVPERELVPRWRHGLRDAAAPGKGMTLQCLLDGKPAIVIHARGGYVDIGMISPERMEAVVAVLEHHGLKVGRPDPAQPDSLLLIAGVLSLAFVGLFAIYLYPAFEDRNETFAGFSAFMVALMLLGGFLLVSTAGRADDVSLMRARTSMALFLPGFLLLAPWSLLLTPLFRLRLHLNFVRLLSRKP